jgi:hypothetical protein
MTRRRVLRVFGSLAGAAVLQPWCFDAFAQAVGGAALGEARVRRRALVIGNTVYSPDPQSIPSSRKNATDVADALGGLGFEVKREVDSGTQAMRASLQEFFGSVRGGSDPPLAVLYYTGHGLQYLGENYVVPSDVNLAQKADGIARGSINVDREVLAQAVLPNNGTCVLIFDACRNDPSKGREDLAGSFNQVNPPRGTIITYSTAPGRYAIAPRSAEANSIYTGILVDELRKANAEITVKDFLDAVKFRVRRFMLENQDPFLRKHAQDPEVAANITLRLSFALQKAPRAPAADTAREAARKPEQDDWALIERTVEPAERAKLLKGFIDRYPQSALLQAAQVQLERAGIAEAASDKTRVQIEKDVGDSEFQSDQAKALDGDKDAAYRVAQMFKDGTNGLPRDERKMVQWLRLAAELKNGIASYQLYLYYRDRKLDRDAVRYENLARELGYTPPPRLDTRRG